MQEFERQKEKMEMTTEVMGYAIDDALEGDEEEEEIEELVNQVLDEIGIDINQEENKDFLNDLLDQSISLDPLTVVIKELASAAKEAEDEANIQGLCSVSVQIHFLLEQFHGPMMRALSCSLSDMSGKSPLYKKYVTHIKKDLTVIPRIGALREMNLEYFAIDCQLVRSNDRRFMPLQTVEDTHQF